jgi:hypothetical protein
MLGNGAQDVDCEPVCLREIDRLKLDARRVFDDCVARPLVGSKQEGFA